MAHIANCLAAMETTTTKPPSPDHQLQNSSTPATTEKPYTWRMQQHPPPSQHKRYQLFPKDRQLNMANAAKEAGNTKTTQADKAAAPTVIYPEEQTEEQPAGSNTLKTRINQHSIVRRRKVSVPELGPMTTVQEVPMDSPTIPGRPPIHERSISAPTDDWKQQQEQGQFAAIDSFFNQDSPFVDQQMHVPSESGSKRPSPASSRPVSPKQLPPLVIPPSGSRNQHLIPRRPLPHNRSASDEASHPYTPSTSMTDLSTPCTTGTSSNYPMSAMTLPTPVSATIQETSRNSPKPWERSRSNTPTTMERSRTPQPAGSQRVVPNQGHRRGVSESASASIMDRGRPRKRSETNLGSKFKRSESSADTAADRSSERKAFEELPAGYLPKDAGSSLDEDELDSIHQQAYSQAKRFEVLKTDDVDALSKELRRLDERTEYLRRTYTSLVAGRRNLQSRICQFLRSPRVAKFSYESMLKQEEALAELDSSINDWVQKLEMAENRRTRVRQKLLEHVAAAVILKDNNNNSSACECSHHARGMRSTPIVHDIATPPRSPTKPFANSRAANSSPSPQRVVAQVPSTILENPVIEEAEKLQEQTVDQERKSRADVESIRIYAGDDIATLFADVQNEISRISMADPSALSSELPEEDRREVHRKQSHELLSGIAEHPIDPSSPPAPPPPAKDVPVEPPTLLSNAVFKP